MRRSSRSRYEELRRQRSRQRWHKLLQDQRHRKLLVGVAALVLSGVLVLALVVGGGSEAPAPDQIAQRPTSAKAPTARTLRATARPIGGTEPQAAPPATPGQAPVTPPALMDDWRLTSEQGLTVDAVQALLESFPGPLKTTHVDVGDRTHSLAEILVGQTSLYSLNPKVVLALLELQQGLLSDPAPAPEKLEWAVNFQGEEGHWSGLPRQTRWAVRELHRGLRDYLTATELVFADETTAPIPAGLNAGSYAVLRVLAQTTTPDRLPELLSDDPNSFLDVYTRLFGDPREPLGELPDVAAPFLSYPMEMRSPVTSFFDHEYPFLSQNGTLVSYWSRREDQISYDGHDGWDYGGLMGGGVLAAAPGTVLWAGNSDDGCGVPARGVILDHGNGYRTLYWHLSSVEVELGQQLERGQVLGMVGASGCATGPHLHFQVQYLGRDTDPYGWCGSDQDDPWAIHPVGAPSRWLWIDSFNPCDPPQDGVLVASGGEGFTISGDWTTVDVGVAGPSLWAASYSIVTPTPAEGETEEPAPAQPLEGELEPVTPEQTATPAPPSVAVWSPALPGPGRYRVLAYIPYLYNGLEEATSVRYAIVHAGGTSEVEIDQRVLANHWADLGVYDFDPQHGPAVTLTNAAHAAQESVWAGAMLWLPAE